MIAQVKSLWVVITIFIDKLYDVIHRFMYGIPNLRKSQITANLYLGSQYNLIGLNKLKALGVTAIINMRTHSVYTEAHHEGIKYIHLPTIDNTPPTMADLITGATFAEGEIKAGGIVYIHCRQGIGRGPTMAIAYLIKIGTTLEDALKLVKKVRPFINPRPEQLARLKEFEAHYHSNLIVSNS